VVQLGENRRFALEATHGVGVSEVRVQDLDGDLSIERRVHGPVNGTRAAAPQLVD